eukprot:TRINITY_DN2243_c0_g1_i6.p1 TRINITY_DN2243_c0_g1~~TRINITY_DN2243_c0_g1_i6.p1  ORF type:complete len:234 (+),score=18.95 TRINITY_DN2243_c0_g1_i6:63-764(+)
MEELLNQLGSPTLWDETKAHKFLGILRMQVYMTELRQVKLRSNVNWLQALRMMDNVSPLDRALIATAVDYLSPKVSTPTKKDIKEPIRLGRNHQSQLNDPTISADHAVVRLTPAGPMITDTSTNGTFYLPSARDIELKSGQRIQIVDKELKVERFELEGLKPHLVIALMEGETVREAFRIPFHSSATLIGSCPTSTVFISGQSLSDFEAEISWREDNGRKHAFIRSRTVNRYF